MSARSNRAQYSERGAVRKPPLRKFCRDKPLGRRWHGTPCSCRRKNHIFIVHSAQSNWGKYHQEEIIVLLQGPERLYC